MAKPVVLIVRDGWGKNPSHDWDRANAVLLANTPIDDAIVKDYPSTLIATSGFDVGLPQGTMGNSEVGHQNLGAGRIVNQESVRISKAILSGEFFDNRELNAAIDHAIAKNSKLHVFGIVSDAGVHGMLDHLYGVLELCKRRAFTNVFLHAFTDGRDSPPSYGIKYIKEAEAKMAELGVGRIATVAGRFWAMDRDNRWQRVEKAYDAIAYGKGPMFKSAIDAVQHYYDHPTEAGTHGDEFVTPSVITDAAGKPLARTEDGDSVIFYNYRGDRPRELTKAFVYTEFPYTVEIPAAPDNAKTEKDVPPAPTQPQTVTHGFERPKKIDLYFVTMAAYEQSLPVHVAYPKLGKMTNILAQVVSDAGLKQFRCAETEKFPHVTFFFNDYREPPFPGEDRGIVPSPKLLPDGSPLTTYDQKPDMSAEGVCQATVDAIKTGEYSLVVVNFANGDMVGHTGSLPAAIKACEVVDNCVGRVIAATKEMGGSLIVTADHGNAEQMIDPQTGGPHTAHTIYTVELIVVDDRFKGHKLREGGRLADVAPTLLQMMGLPQPAEMTGQSLIV